MSKKTEKEYEDELVAWENNGKSGKEPLPPQVVPRTPGKWKAYAQIFNSAGDPVFEDESNIPEELWLKLPKEKKDKLKTKIKGK